MEMTRRGGTSIGECKGSGYALTEVAVDRRELGGELENRRREKRGSGGGYFFGEN